MESKRESILGRKQDFMKCFCIKKVACSLSKLTRKVILTADWLRDKPSGQKSSSKQRTLKWQAIEQALYTYAHAHAHTNLQVHTCMHVHTYVYVHAYVHAYVHVHKYVHVNTIHVHIHICTCMTRKFAIC
jgi:hypothetical protein